MRPGALVVVLGSFCHAAAWAQPTLPPRAGSAPPWSLTLQLQQPRAPGLLPPAAEPRPWQLHEALAQREADSARLTFERFRAALRMPLGDRVARLELDRPEPDLERARQGLLDFMAEAIETWREADEQIAALDELAGRIRRTVRAGPQAAAAGSALPALMAELGRQNDRLTLLERRFSERLGAASRQAGRLVLAATLLLGLALAAAAVALSLRTLRRRVRAEQALRASEERLQRALDASGLALWDYDVPSGEVYLSESWAQALGGAPAVTRTTFAELTALVPDSDCPALQQSLVAALGTPGPSTEWSTACGAAMAAGCGT